MKKVLVVSALAALSLSVYAQGLVSIQESTLTISTNATSVNGGTSGRISSTANSYYFELLTVSDPTGSTTLPTDPSFGGLTATGLGSWSDTGVSGTNATGINGGKISAIGAVPGITIANPPASGGTNFFIVVGWSANEGSSWSTVLNEATTGNWAAFGANTAFGISLVGYGVPGTSPNPGDLIFGTNPGQISSGFTLTAVSTPEPATMALAAIGGASLLLFRRKK
jgi:hypothetical protein